MKFAVIDVEIKYRAKVRVEADQLPDLVGFSEAFLDNMTEECLDDIGDWALEEAREYYSRCVTVTRDDSEIHSIVFEEV